MSDLFETEYCAVCGESLTDDAEMYCDFCIEMNEENASWDDDGGN